MEGEAWTILTSSGIARASPSLGVLKPAKQFFSEPSRLPEHQLVNVIGHPNVLQASLFALLRRSWEWIFGRVRAEKVAQNQQGDDKPRRSLKPNYNLAILALFGVPVICVVTRSGAANIGIGLERSWRIETVKYTLGHRAIRRSQPSGESRARAQQCDGNALSERFMIWGPLRNAAWEFARIYLLIN